MRFDGSCALVTGGLRGIGLAVTEQLLSEGARVLLTDLDEPDAVPVSLVNAEATYLQADVSSEEDWRSVVQAATQQFGRLDVLVNNAGSDAVGAVEDLDYSTWRRVFGVNADGVFLGTKYCQALLAAGGADRVGGAAIVNVSSIMSTVGFSDTSAYNASKGAVRSLTKATAIEFAGKKVPIRVNSVHPGFVMTPLLETGFKRLVESGVAGDVDAVAKSLAAMTPMGRLAQPSEVANTITFLASEQASYVTGSELYVDGGWTAQ